MQPKFTFYSNELSHFLSGKECKKSSCHTELATEDTFCIKHNFKFFLQSIYSNSMTGDEFDQKIWARVTFEKNIFLEIEQNVKKRFFYNVVCTAKFF